MNIIRSSFVTPFLVDMVNFPEERDLVFMLLLIKKCDLKAIQVHGRPLGPQKNMYSRWMQKFIFALG